VARTVLLRILGLLVAATLALAAIQLLGYGLEQEPVFERWLGDVASAARGTLSEGGAMLAGVAIAVVALAVAWVALRRPSADTIRLERSPQGRSRVERKGLAESLERSLRQTVHPQVVVAMPGKRLLIDAPVRSATQPLEFVDELAVVVPEELIARGLPGVRYRISTGTRTKRRVR
jgi:hypothetical protein